MRSAVLQFLLAGALVVAWIWMLGRPLLAMLARRSRRDSVGHFRYQQAALGRTVGLDAPGRSLALAPLRPLVEWRAQPLVKRRLQVLLGSGLATFASVLLAIALRGSYIRLLAIMTVGFTLHLLVAAFIGSRELRSREVEQRRRSIDAATRSAGRPVTVAVEESDDQHREHDPYGIEDLLAGDGIGGGLFDEGFFEPIPELDPEASPGSRNDRAPADPGQVDQPDVGEPSTPAATADEAAEPTFTSPAAVKPRPGRRPKGRPIYVEPEPDEGDGTIRAVND